MVTLAFYEQGKAPARITWDDDFVGEVHRTVKACQVFLFFPFFWLCEYFRFFMWWKRLLMFGFCRVGYSQIDGNLGTTAAGMTLNGTPNDLIVCVPLPLFVLFEC